MCPSIVSTARTGNTGASPAGGAACCAAPPDGSAVAVARLTAPRSMRQLSALRLSASSACRRSPRFTRSCPASPAPCSSTCKGSAAPALLASGSGRAAGNAHEGRISAQLPARLRRRLLVPRGADAHRGALQAKERAPLGTACERRLRQAAAGRLERGGRRDQPAAGDRPAASRRARAARRPQGSPARRATARRGSSAAGDRRRIPACRAAPPAAAGPPPAAAHRHRAAPRSARAAAAPRRTAASRRQRDTQVEERRAAQVDAADSRAPRPPAADDRGSTPSASCGVAGETAGEAQRRAARRASQSARAALSWKLPLAARIDVRRARARRAIRCAHAMPRTSGQLPAARERGIAQRRGAGELRAGEVGQGLPVQGPRQLSSALSMRAGGELPGQAERGARSALRKPRRAAPRRRRCSARCASTASGAPGRSAPSVPLPARVRAPRRSCSCSALTRQPPARAAIRSRACTCS